MHHLARCEGGGGGAGDAREARVPPSSATRAIFRLLKARERVFQTLLLTKTVFRTPKGAQPLFQARFGVKTLSETLSAPPLMKPGDEKKERVTCYGARSEAHGVPLRDLRAGRCDCQ